MNPPSPLYALHDLHLRVTWDAADLQLDGDAVLNYAGFRTINDEPADEAWHLVVTFGEEVPPIPEDAEEIGQDPYDVVLFRHSANTYLRRNHSGATIEPETRQIRLTVAATATAVGDLYLLLTHCIISLVPYHGYLPLHAGALCYHEADGLLFIAASDSGKSTLTFGLIRQGWPFLTDDSLLLRLEDDEVVARPLRWDGSLDPHATVTFPEIEAHRKPLLPGASKWRIDLDAAYPGQRRLQCVPRVLVFPSIVDEPESMLSPVSRTGAFLHLLPQTALLATRHTDAHLTLLKHLTQQARAFRLLAGHDLKANPDRVAEVLRPALGVEG